MRSGDLRAVARAAARARVAGVTVPREDVRVARYARHAIAAAIVTARHPHVAVAAPRRGETRTLRAGRRLRPLLLLALLCLLLALLFGLEGGGGSPEVATSVEVVTPVASVVSVPLRGRSAVSLPPEIVAVQPSPTAEPSRQPAATATPPPSPSGAGGGAGGSGAGGGSGSGAGSGSGSGVGSGSGSGIGVLPAPTLPPVPPPGYSRLTVIVVDSRTRVPLPDACVIVGTTSCDRSPHTDQRGRWSADVPTTTAPTSWQLTLLKAGYNVQSRTFVMSAGRRSVVVEIRLVRS